MKVIIAGDRTVKDLTLVEQAIERSGFNITTVISGCCQGIDSLGEEWARRHNIPIEHYPAEWNNMDQPGAIPKVNKWGRTYNATAGLARNEKMAQVGDALIAIQPNGPTSGTQHMIKMAKKHKIQIYEYEKTEDEYEYQF